MAKMFKDSIRQVVCLTLATMLASGSVDAAPGNSTEPGKSTIQERILLGAPEGTLVEVRLASKEKLRGRMLEVKDKGFVLQVANADRIEQREVAFDEVKKLKVKKDVDGMSTGQKVVLGGLAGVGIFFLALIVIVAAAGS